MHPRASMGTLLQPKVQRSSSQRQMHMCSVCGMVALSPIRFVSKGGNGYCLGCEDHLRRQAEEAGADLPASGARWEVRWCASSSSPRSPTRPASPSRPRWSTTSATCSAAPPLPPVECWKRKVRTDNDGGQVCDTDRKRRPDLLFLLRHPETSRITHALNVEIDEHSHEDRDVEELFDRTMAAESINALAQEEFKSRHAAVDWKAEVPITLTLRFNPNAFDGKKVVRLEERVRQAFLLLLLLSPLPARTGRVRPVPPARQVLLLPLEAGREAPLRLAEGARRKKAILPWERCGLMIPRCFLF